MPESISPSSTSDRLSDAPSTSRDGLSDKTPHSPISHRDQVGQLSRKSFVAMLVAMFIVPIATVLTLWFYLPPVSMYTLDATVTLVGMERAKEFDRREAIPAVPEPRVVVKNIGQDEWTQLIVEVNKRYKVYRTDEVVPAGETIEFGLDYFMTREGLFFPPGQIDVKHVRVYARLPSRSRATYEADFDAEFNVK